MSKLGFHHHKLFEYVVTSLYMSEEQPNVEEVENVKNQPCDKCNKKWGFKKWWKKHHCFSEKPSSSSSEEESSEDIDENKKYEVDAKEYKKFLRWKKMRSMKKAFAFKYGKYHDGFKPMGPHMGFHHCMPPGHGFCPGPFMGGPHFASPEFEFCQNPYMARPQCKPRGFHGHKDCPQGPDRKSVV